MWSLKLCGKGNYIDCKQRNVTIDMIIFIGYIMILL